MAQTYDICIRGAGIVGRTLALHLAAKRLRVALCATPNSASPSASDVRAYALNQPARALLEAVRCWPAESQATPVQRMEVHGDDGATVVFDAADQDVAALNWIVDVPALEAQLAEAVRYQPLIELVDTPAPATLTVVCEGRASRTREELGVDFSITPYNQTAIAARVECAQSHGQVARQWFHQGEILALLPLSGPGGNFCAVVWSVSAERAHTLQALPDMEFSDTLHAASHGALGSLTLTSPRHTWPLQHALASRWSGSHASGPWVLAGDAAHNVHPLAGQGLNLGLGDVAELVRVLDGRPYWRSVADPKLLRAYERARKADFALVGGAGDALQQLFAHPHAAAQGLRNWGMHQFNTLGAVKHWVAQRAMGTRPQ
ncbi:FAD-dependent monooxygenase [Rhodoferax saidenbachensis]|uniref:2-polyprenyl-6-methoxyphenol hydroxylase-like FAD-dependent oxidoreductase n=1 Tax=Rhodoferax saidenbachensis TaxID=1484693 RepID=A0ABU1ZK27_9BURK|nr:FAD-dependent monooxygenase [Rhodoferax saidenbachensis]MDR7305904.1 2-polyprenyl-6-methoxyphenol hydroxylase-like FAD-dependent oxidoreductase [Rhodoferax saidenbachensis]